MSIDRTLTATVKALARREGFARVGIAPIDADLNSQRFDRWLAEGMGAEMAYMARNVEKRHRPEKLVDGARSVICLAVSYAPAAETLGDAFIARYARGRDYHKLLKKRCHRLMDRIGALEPSFDGRAFVDAAPVAERALAAAAGIGWIGKNGCLIAPGLGSYVVLCEIVSNLPLAPDEPVAAQCGDCDACIGACPTGALVGDGMLDARRCRSYLTIEHRGEIDRELWPLMDACVFGCDDCQAVCPHNRDLPPGDDDLARLRDAIEGLTIGDVLDWSADDWDAATRGSAMRRATHEMFLRNAALAARVSG